MRCSHRQVATSHHLRGRKQPEEPPLAALPRCPLVCQHGGQLAAFFAFTVEPFAQVGHRFGHVLSQRLCRFKFSP